MPGAGRRRRERAFLSGCYKTSGKRLIPAATPSPAPRARGGQPGAAAGSAPALPGFFCSPSEPKRLSAARLQGSGLPRVRGCPSPPGLAPDPVLGPPPGRPRLSRWGWGGYIGSAPPGGSELPQRGLLSAAGAGAQRRPAPLRLAIFSNLFKQGGKGENAEK